MRHTLRPQLHHARRAERVALLETEEPPPLGSLEETVLGYLNSIKNNNGHLTRQNRAVQIQLFPIETIARWWLKGASITRRALSKHFVEVVLFCSNPIAVHIFISTYLTSLRLASPRLTCHQPRQILISSKSKPVRRSLLPRLRSAISRRALPTSKSSSQRLKRIRRNTTESSGRSSGWPTWLTICVESIPVGRPPSRTRGHRFMRVHTHAHPQRAHMHTCARCACTRAPPHVRACKRTRPSRCARFTSVCAVQSASSIPTQPLLYNPIYPFASRSSSR